MTNKQAPSVDGLMKLVEALPLKAARSSRDDYERAVAAIRSYAEGLSGEAVDAKRLQQVNDLELPGMWESADYLGGEDEAREYAQTRRCATLKVAAREAANALQSMLLHFTRTPSTLSDSAIRGDAHIALNALRSALAAISQEAQE
jgi:hypothetical protein